MNKKWYHQLREAKFKEFSFFPNAYTPIEEDKSLALPPVELELGGGESEESEQESATPEWVKNVSFTIAGITIGGAAVYSLFAATPVPSCPAPVSTEQTTQNPLPSAPSTPVQSSGSAGTPPRTTPATTSPANSGGTTTPSGGSTVPGTL